MYFAPLHKGILKSLNIWQVNLQNFLKAQLINQMNISYSYLINIFIILTYQHDFGKSMIRKKKRFFTCLLTLLKYKRKIIALKSWKQRQFLEEFSSVNVWIFLLDNSWEKFVAIFCERFLLEIWRMKSPRVLAAWSRRG